MIRYLKLLVLSLIGVVLFFVPIDGKTVTITLITNLLKGLLGNGVRYISIISVTVLAAVVILAEVFHVSWAEKYLGNTGKAKLGFFLASCAVVWLVLLKIGPSVLQEEAIGPRVLNLASNVFMTIAVAGFAVIFLLQSGIVEFISVLVEPIMRPLFHLPGEAAVNVVSSFVSSASVGVYFTEQYYRNGTYTLKEAMDVAMNFSVISVGYMAVLVSLTGIESMYGVVIASAFICVLIMGMIMIRIPPFSHYPDIYADGRKQTESDIRVEKLGAGKRFEKALESGCSKAESFHLKNLGRSFLNAIRFAQTITGVMIACVTIVLILVNHTQLFQYLGMLFVPYLKLLGVPEAVKTAPSVVLEFVEVSLPSISAASYNLPQASMFFVVLLSILQVIFMTEAGNAMLSSSLPIRFIDLVIVFMARTVIAMPMAALVMHMIF